MQINVNVLFFAKGRELAGTSAERLQVAVRAKEDSNGGGVTLRDVVDTVYDKFPQLKADSSFANSVMFAVNQTYVSTDEEVIIADGDEVALIPPVSGG